MTYAELLELGHQVATDPTCRDLMRGDPPRPLTNVEMMAVHTWHTDQIWTRIDRDGCCGGQMDDWGMCPETGRSCPLFRKAQQIEQQTFHATEDL
jgi:hypothetical protein